MKNIVITGLLSLSLATAAIAANPVYQTEAPIAYMTDLSSGAVLFSRGADQPIPPASMAKMMTVYVAFDLIEKGDISLDQKMNVNEDTWRKWNNQGSAMFLKVNEQVSVSDLLHGIVTLSGNDACVVLADGIAGSEASFVEIMNKTAKKLGMKNSRFGNSNGWPDEGQTVVTAHDLALLGAATVRDFPKLYKQFYGTTQYTWNGITQPNRNPLLGKIAGADGLKTGHTEEAGYGFTGTAEQDGRRIIMVLAGLDSFNGRIDESVRFMNWGFKAWKTRPLFAQGSTVGTAKVQLGDVREVSLIAPRNLAVTLPRSADPDFKLSIVYNGPVKAPIAKGAPIANLIVKTGEGPDQVMPLVAANSVGEAGLFGRMWSGLLNIFGA